MARILVIEDSKTVQHYIKTILSREDHEVLSCYDGGGAREMALHKGPAAVLLDIMLPQCSGFHIAEEFECHPQLAHLPIVMVSSIAERERIREVVSLGNVCGYVIKPFNTHTLVSKVDQALQLRQSWMARRAS